MSKTFRPCWLSWLWEPCGPSGPSGPSRPSTKGVVTLMRPLSVMKGGKRWCCRLDHRQPLLVDSIVTPTPQMKEFSTCTHYHRFCKNWDVPGFPAAATLAHDANSASDFGIPHLATKSPNRTKNPHALVGTVMYWSLYLHLM